MLLVDNGEPHILLCHEACSSVALALPIDPKICFGNLTIIPKPSLKRCLHFDPTPRRRLRHQLIFVRRSEKSNKMSEKMKIEIALDYSCSGHDQFDTVSILRNDEFVYFL